MAINGGNIKVSATGQVANNDYILNNSSGSIENDGIINNVQCAIIKNDNFLQNDATILNSGIIYNNGTITPNSPLAVGSGIVTIPGNPAGLCEDITVQLDGSGNAPITPWDVLGTSSDNCNFVNPVSVTPRLIN